MEFDRALFVTLNERWHNPVFDAVMPFLTNLNKTVGFWVVSLLLLFWLWRRGGAHGRLLVVLLALAVPSTDVISSHVAKNIYYRRRPCCPVAFVPGANRPLTDAEVHNSEVPGDRVLPFGAAPLTSSSLPSSHSATMTALAVLLIWGFRKRTRWAWLALLLPLVIGYSRIYVGVHYPLDVLGGWLLGAGCGLTACWFGSRWESKHIREAENLENQAALTG